MNPLELKKSIDHVLAVGRGDPEQGVYRVGPYDHDGNLLIRQNQGIRMKYKGVLTKDKALKKWPYTVSVGAKVHANGCSSTWTGRLHPMASAEDTNRFAHLWLLNLASYYDKATSLEVRESATKPIREELTLLRLRGKAAFDAWFAELSGV